MKKRISKRVFFLGFILTFLAISYFAQDGSYYNDPWTAAPGFRPEMPYRSLSENESVNIYNGNLTAISPHRALFSLRPWAFLSGKTEICRPIFRNGGELSRLLRSSNRNW